MNEVTITEQNVIDTLIAKSKVENEIAPRVVVVNRTQDSRSLRRTVRFALIVSTNNETLIDALIQETVDNDLGFTFVGSDVNLQSDLEIDYLFFEAKIFAKKI